MDHTRFIDFVKNKYPLKSSVFLHEPVFIGNEKKYINDAIDSTFVSSVGKYVDQFENDLSAYVKSEKSIAVVNGTSGLQVALRLVDVKANDEVITQSLTFVATANAIIYNNAVPVFLDVDYDTMGLSPVALKNFLEENCEIIEDKCFNKKSKRFVKACVPMHTFGFPVRIKEISEICNNWNIALVEDAAESLGSFVDNQHTGTFGKVGVFSFNGNKIITSGGGGAIVTNDIALGKQAKHLTTTAKIPHPYEFMHDEIGYNFRMPNLNAALICAQLEMINRYLVDKRELALEYKKYFDSSGIIFREEMENTQANYWLMCVELENKKERDLFLETTNKNGVMTRPIWQLMTDLEMYKHYYKDGQENSRKLVDRIVNIPSGVRL
jgi:perosamine synthetase